MKCDDLAKLVAFERFPQGDMTRKRLRIDNACFCSGSLESNQCSFANCDTDLCIGDHHHYEAVVTEKAVLDGVTERKSVHDWPVHTLVVHGPQSPALVLAFCLEIRAVNARRR